MLDVIKEALIDSIKLLPFLFIVYLIMEYIEHKAGNKTAKAIENAGKAGPLIGGLLGAFPQCGFSVMAANLYVAGIISMGTIISIFISTSDEMLPLMISSGISIDRILKIIGIKVLIAVFFGLLIDFFISRKSKKAKKEIGKICEHEHCHCEKNIFVSSLKHSLNIFVFIIVANLLIDFIIYFIGEKAISNLFVQNSLIGPFVSALIGLMPNCASSVIITELYINGTINFGSLMSGLMMNSGVALLVLFKLNKNHKENFTIIGLTYLIAIITGIIINILKIAI